MSTVVPVSSLRGDVIHLLDIGEHDGWEPGDRASAACGRKGAWYIAHSFMGDEMRPCVRCDSLGSVMVSVFTMEQMIEESGMELPIRREFDPSSKPEVEAHHHELAPFESIQRFIELVRWLEAGIQMGFVSPPECWSDHESEESCDHHHYYCEIYPGNNVYIVNAHDDDGDYDLA